MRRATWGVLIGFVGLTTGAFVWADRLRLTAVRPGVVSPWGASVGRDVPARFGEWSGLSTPGFSPIRVYFNLPASAKSLFGSQEYDWSSAIPPKGKIPARLVLPDGSTAPVSLATESRTNKARIDLFGDVPPTIKRLDVEVFIPGKPVSRLRLTGFPTGNLVFDVDRRVTAQGSVSGNAWWQGADGKNATPAVFASLKIAGVRRGKGENADLRYRIEAPFAEPGHRPWVSIGGTTSLPPGSTTLRQWVNTRYASYTKAVRATGTVRRYRYFDETIDLGASPLKSRSSGFKLDTTLVLEKARSATTPGGLRLTIPARAPKDQTHYALGGLTVVFPLDVDRASVAQGLPPDMARLAKRQPVEISIMPLTRKLEWFTGVDYDPRLREENVVPNTDIVLSESGAKRPAKYPLRFRVRRRVLVEATPFDLTLPVERPLHPVTFRRGSGSGSGIY